MLVSQLVHVTSCDWWRGATNCDTKIILRLGHFYENCTMNSRHVRFLENSKMKTRHVIDQITHFLDTITTQTISSGGRTYSRPVSGTF